MVPDSGGLRETFLLPVTWKNDWPVILEHGKAVQTFNAKKGVQLKVRPSQTPEQLGITGNFSYTDRFDSTALNQRWTFVRNPSAFYATGTGGLVISGLPTSLSVKENPLAVFVHQQNASFTAETEMTQTLSLERHCVTANLCLSCNAQRKRLWSLPPRR